MSRRACLTALLALIVSAALPLAAPARADALRELTAAVTGLNSLERPAFGLFRTIEFRSDSLALLPQWRRVVRRQAEEQPRYVACMADPASCADPQLDAWRRIIVTARDLDRFEQIEAVNSYFNRWPYRTDQSVYGVSEYWATPREFLLRSGDCEDYSIAKFFALRQLGFDAEDVRVVILMDQIRGIGHAVLAVRFDRDILILDNLSDLILSHRKYPHYVPQYSMNETSRWAHLRATAPLAIARTSGAAPAEGR